MAFIDYKEWCSLNILNIQAFIPTPLSRLLLSDYVALYCYGNIVECAACCQLYICPALFFSRRNLTPAMLQFDLFALFFGYPQK